jgi:L,D-transpeptidase YcbB
MCGGPPASVAGRLIFDVNLVHRFRHAPSNHTQFPPGKSFVTRFFGRTMPSARAWAFVVAFAVALGCQGATAQSGQIEQTIQLTLQSGAGLDLRDVDALRKFYGARQYRTAWYDDRGINADGRTAVAEMSASADEGLDPARYELTNINKPLSNHDAAAIAYRDLLLTAQLLRYAADVRSGRDEFKQLDSDVDLPHDSFDAASALSQSLQERTLPLFFDGLPPQSSTYASLKGALSRYRAIAAGGGWPELVLEPKVEAKTASPEVLLALQNRLIIEDKAIKPSSPPLASEIDSAIRRFQTSNGLGADGVIGKRTLAALNFSAAARAAQIAANMERLRWLPHPLEKAYVAVNVPNATLVVVDNGAEVLASRVIVGRPADRTPIFRAMITEVVANPPWIVPAPIARKEILPKIRRDPTYLADHQMIITDGQIRQLPGASNALGFLKLNVSDRFAVYLHDTPSRALFARDERFLSHGCIRVQQIAPLASYAMTGDTSVGADDLTAAIATGQTVHLPIRTPLALYVNYFTVFLSADGTLQFRSDIYGRDARLIAAMGRTSFTRAAGLAGACRRPA